MQKSKRSLTQQRLILDAKLAPWVELANSTASPPRIGWLKAVREALGLSSRQLGRRLGISNSSVIEAERREVEKKATLETLEKAARAMNCKLVYAIVPERDSSLEALIDRLCLAQAQRIKQQVVATMKLEEQEADPRLVKDVKSLADELKKSMDASVWEEG